MSNIVIPTITVNGQTILHTENKYCGENIEVNVAIPNPTLDGTAITDYVLAPYTFYKDNLTKLIGTMVNRGAISTDITTKEQEVTIQQGYHSGSGKVKISATEQAKIIPTNIKKDVSILGVVGTYEGSGSTPTMKGYTITNDGSGILLTAPNYYASTQVIIIGTLKYSSEDYDMEGNDWEAVFVINHLLDVLSFSVTVTKNNSYGLTSSYTGVGGSIITTSAQALSTEVLPDVNYGNAGFMNITSVSDITPLYSN